MLEKWVGREFAGKKIVGVDGKNAVWKDDRGSKVTTPFAYLARFYEYEERIPEGNELHVSQVQCFGQSDFGKILMGFRAPVTTQLVLANMGFDITKRGLNVVEGALELAGMVRKGRVWERGPRFLANTSVEMVLPQDPSLSQKLPATETAASVEKPIPPAPPWPPEGLVAMKGPNWNKAMLSHDLRTFVDSITAPGGCVPLQVLHGMWRGTPMAFEEFVKAMVDAEYRVKKSKLGLVIYGNHIKETEMDSSKASAAIEKAAAQIQKQIVDPELADVMAEIKAQTEREALNIDSKYASMQSALDDWRAAARKAAFNSVRVKLGLAQPSDEVGIAADLLRHSVDSMLGKA